MAQEQLQQWNRRRLSGGSRGLPGAARWRKSTYSNGSGGNCLEVCDAHTAVVPVRDSKVPDGPVLTVTAQAWTSFVASLK